MNAHKTIVILGGGIGGIVTANVLAKKIGKSAKIILIDRERNHIFPPALLHLMMGERTTKDIQKPLSELEKKGVRVITDEVMGINPKEKIVNTTKHEFPYDYLVIALGAKLSPETIPGLINSGYNLYDLTDVERLRDLLLTFHDGRIAVVISSLPYKCPAAPYEAAFLLDAYFTKRKLRQKVALSVFTPEPFPLPATGEKIGARVKDMLQKSTIDFYPNVNLQKVDEKSHQLVFSSRDTHKFDLLFYIPPHQGTQVVKESGLGNDSGFIPVDKYTFETAFPNVFAIGDANSITLSSKKPLPKAGVFAHAQAEVVAQNIINSMRGKEETKMYDGKASCFLETGFGKAGFASGNFYHEPTPLVTMKSPSKIWYLGKMKFEKYWLWKWF